ncbi:MerR family transcriptional regulator [Paenibacillus roseipurpureus]|uniref:MerR family transcriptional regulator n=1 Tax=Paenibacillus roseopurpureus TaxID=2918901 RepID=A0AA96LQY4_9BACL|nr:MerR family transcriptional regulator [Paenibacillus sp. MBLB1832]WNR45653.1 MerR family transcriptional regulator [Paenibacillus sp. MBLB1832]
MRISELSKLTGASIRSLRYYEAKGLIATQREENGYRVYNQMVVERVKTIQFYLSLGFTTEQIESFLNCVMKNQESQCDDLLPLYTEKLQEIEKQMAMLQLLQANLKDRIAFIEEQRRQGLPIGLPST